MHRLKFENVVHEPQQVPFSTSMDTAVDSGRVPVVDLEHKLTTFLRSAGYPVVRVTVELAEIPNE